MSGKKYRKSRTGDPVLVFLTSKRIRYLGAIVGISHILAGLILLLLSPTYWRIQHLAAYVSFILLPFTGIITIFFSRFKDLAIIVNNARIAGYEASEEEKTLEEESIQRAFTLYLFIPPAYTVASLLLIYFVVEPSGVLTTGWAYQLYLGLTWVLPMTLIIFIALPYYIYKRYAKLRVFWHNSAQGVRLMKRMRESGVGNSEDLRIIDEDESKKNKEE